MTDVWIVTGLYRSGTSMMMRALANSLTGVTPLVDTSLDALADAQAADLATYRPNPNGYWVPPANPANADSDTGQFVHVYPGRLLKVRMEDMFKVPAVAGQTLHVCFMIRPLAAINRSLQKAFNWQIGPTQIAQRRDLRTILTARRDVNLTAINYGDVIADATATPVATTQFQRLVTDGWPIDPVVAMNFVDKALARNQDSG